MTSDDFNFDDYYEPPTQEFIRNSLTYGMKVESSAHSQPMTTQVLQSGDPVPLYMLRSRSKLARTLFRYAYKKKSQILRIPILGNFALFINNKMNERNLKSMDSNLPRLDLAYLMALEPDDFIKQLYIEALGRPPDPGGKEGYKHAMTLGASKEAIVYLICTSDEFGGRAQVVHFDQYQKAYRQYRSQQMLKRIPVLSQLLFFREELERIRNQLLALDTTVEALSSTVEALSSTVEALSSTVKALSSAIEITNDKVEETSSSLLAAINHNRPPFYSFPGGVTVIRMKDYIFGVPSEEWRLALFLNTYGFFEPGTEKYFRSILREGMNILDIGANLGIYTLHALAAGCHVYSYEPTPNIFNILLDNIGINGFEPSGRAKAYNLAVSDVEGEMEFAIYANISGHNSFYASNDNDRRIKVKTICLDHHLSHLTHVDVVKIDVEGAEPLVLKGMKEIIEKNPAIKIIVEFGPSNLKRGGHDPLEFLTTIRRMGLDILKINEETGELQKISDPDLCAVYSANVLLTKTPWLDN
jgi:FkbM family methyltransferase